MITPQLMINLLLILIAAWIMGGLFSRYGLPFVLGELLAGVILGPPLLGLIEPSPAIELLAELGILFVMFHTGSVMLLQGYSEEPFFNPFLSAWVSLLQQ
jgi:Kef-type K+ transport system membrane component KefB